VQTRSTRNLCSFGAQIIGSAFRLANAPLSGGAKGTRTPDLLVANETRYRLRHSPADRWADQHRDFTTVKLTRTRALPRRRLLAMMPKPRPGRPR
jgi:hypothetical protein